MLAVWDRVQVAGRRPVVLDVGCGDTKQYGDNIGVDLRATAATALLADLTPAVAAPDPAQLARFFD